MSDREFTRAAVLRRVVAGEITIRDATPLLALSYRHARRLAARFRAGGRKALIHRSTGRRSNRSIPAAHREQVVELVRRHYGGTAHRGPGQRFGPTLAAEQLWTDHGILVAVTTLRRWMHAAELWGRARRAHRRHQRRERKAHFGELVQLANPCWRAKHANSAAHGNSLHSRLLRHESKDPEIHTHQRRDSSTGVIQGTFLMVFDNVFPTHLTRPTRRVYARRGIQTSRSDFVAARVPEGSIMSDMGIFKTTIEVAPLGQRNDKRELREVMVDTGSEYNWIPRATLEELGIGAEGVEDFETADGRVLTREIGWAILHAGGRAAPTIVVFAEKDDMVLLGALGLESMNLRIDLPRKQLVPAGPVPVAGLCAA